jgi:DNA-binding NarL/FixJ family response regulator
MKTKICIVEDNPDIRNSLEEWVSSSPNFTCAGVFSNAETALIEIPRRKPDVVLMDIRLPGQSGIACTAKLREIMPGIQVIVLTVYRDRNLLYEALKAGASGYLLKRSTPEEVSRAITEVCSGGAPMTPEIARMLVETFQKPVPTAKIGGGGKDLESQGNLSEREMQVLSLVSRGLANKEIGSQLNISFFTVRAHLRKIYEKLHVRCRAEAVSKYLQSDN